MKRGRRPFIGPAKEEREAFALYLQGKQRVEISRLLGISEMTLYRWSKKGSWKEKLKEYESKWQDISTMSHVYEREKEVLLKRLGEISEFEKKDLYKGFFNPE